VYWLIGTLIMTAMLSTLAVVSTTTLADSLPVAAITNPLLVALLLSCISVFLIVITQRNTVSAAMNRAVNRNRAALILRLSLISSGYLLSLALASILVIGSAWQVVNHHQQAEATTITEPMRVQARVTIEGISDSVYDPASASGYRQVVTLRAVKPLTADLSAEQLNAMASNESVIVANNSLSDINNSNNSNRSKDDRSEAIEYRILLNAYPKNAKQDSELAALNQLQPGAQLLMSLTLKPLASSQAALTNPSGFDSYRWLRARHIDGVANIIAMSTPIITSTDKSISAPSSSSYLSRFRVTIDQWRWQLRQHFYQDWATKTIGQQQASAVTLSLLTGDRSLINRDTKDLYQLAGISHLLAISGTHVLFLAIMLAGLAALLFDKNCPLLYRFIARWQLRWGVMIGAAFIYALFTGFDVPAARTAWMLLAIGLVRLTLLPISTLRILLALALLMAWVDPYVLWQAGYWLSFIAVAILLKYDEGRQAPTKASSSSKRSSSQQQSAKKNIFYSKIWPLFKSILRLQCWLFIALLPISLLLFGKVSLWGLVINLFAIGLFGWVIVPLNLLAGLCYLLIPTVADSLWLLVSSLVSRLHELIAWLTALPALQGAWLFTPINSAMLLMALLIMLPWLLPRGLVSRWLALAPLTLLMMTVYANQQTLLLTPTLYILPTSDRYLSAVLLQYPISDRLDDSKKIDNNSNANNNHSDNQTTASTSVSWLFLADHRPSTLATKPSSLTADKLSDTLEQQLRTLSVKRLQGIVLQTATPALTSTLTAKKAQATPASLPADSTADMRYGLLATTVAQLSQRLPVSQYWQAGQHQNWSALNKSRLQGTSPNHKALITAQACEQGKTWQSPNADLKLQALTGWRSIDDVKVWGCSVALDSSVPINIVQYDVTNPQQSPAVTGQMLAKINAMPINSKSEKILQDKAASQATQTRIILDASTDQRSWQLWSLLCNAQPFAINNRLDNSIVWLTHSTSPVSADILVKHKATRVVTYDAKPLEAALMLSVEP
jgi:competence protein ComEC